MNITLTNIDPVNAIIKMNIVQADYAEETEKSLKNLRQKAVIPGFRKGMVPMGYIEKMYKKSVIAEQINKIISKEFDNYLNENNLNILGGPLPSAEHKLVDFDKGVDFEFYFDIALIPEIDIKFTKRDKLPYYLLEIPEEKINDQIEFFKSTYGTYSKGIQIEEKDIVKGLLTELNENGEMMTEEGIEVPDCMLMPSFIIDEEEKNKFIGAKTGDAIIFNPYKAYEGNEAELTSLLHISKEIIDEFQDVNFVFEIKEITHYAEAELNQDLFDKVFSEGNVKTEEEFRNKVKEMIASDTKPDSDYKLLLDARKLFEKKVVDIVLPEAFLKRWLLASDEKKTPEAVEQDFPKFIEDLKHHIVKNQIIKDNNFKAEENDVKELAKIVVKERFSRYYGMSHVPDNTLEKYVKDMLKDEETVNNLVERVLENKLIDWLKEKITLQEKEVTVDEFRKLLFE